MTTLAKFLKSTYKSKGKSCSSRAMELDEAKSASVQNALKASLAATTPPAKVLNVVTYNVQEAPNGFVNSAWKLQDEPFAGDVINSYNDGSPEEGKPPLGPFYELETSSPAAALKPGEKLKHVQRTFHIQGTEEELDPLARKLLGASLEAIKNAF